jgi:hypothetical protein
MAKVYQTFNLAEAQIKVHITQNKGLADIWVYCVNNRGLAHGDAHWFVTDNKADATCRAYFCSVAMSHVIVYFTANRSEAGWQKQHKLMKRL